MKTFAALTEEALGPPDKVFLLYGTTTGKLGQYMGYGIRRPTGDIEQFLKDLTVKYMQGFGYKGNVFPDDLEDKLRFYLDSIRFDMSGITKDKDNCIYMTPSPSIAEDYALSFAAVGSEAEGSAWDWAVWWAGVEFDLDKDSIPEPIKDGKPLVLGAKVPISQTSLSQSKWEKWYATWMNVEVKEPIRSYQTFYFNKAVAEGLEVRVYGDIPESDIFWGVPHLEKSQMDEFVFRMMGV